jgi:two-component system NtrC family sensor kinase
VERCGTITRQLLGFARRFDIQTQSIDLNEMVTDVINFHKKEAEYRNIGIHVDIPESLPLIETDRGKLQQIILNLVNNAFQAIRRRVLSGYSGGNERAGTGAPFHQGQWLRYFRRTPQ